MYPGFVLGIDATLSDNVSSRCPIVHGGADGGGPSEVPSPSDLGRFKGEFKYLIIYGHINRLEIDVYRGFGFAWPQRNRCISHRGLLRGPKDGLYRRIFQPALHKFEWTTCNRYSLLTEHEFAQMKDIVTIFGRGLDVPSRCGAARTERSLPKCRLGSSPSISADTRPQAGTSPGGAGSWGAAVMAGGFGASSMNHSGRRSRLGAIENQFLSRSVRSGSLPVGEELTP